MKQKSVVSIFFMMLICANIAFSQKPNYRQWQANYTFVNPAFAGISGSPRINFGYRNYMPNLVPGFNVFSLNYDQPLQTKNAAIGINTLYYAVADYQDRIFLSGFYAHNFPISDDINLRLGVSAGYLQVRFNNAINWNPPQPPIEPIHAATLGLGGVIHNRNSYVSISTESHTKPIAPVNRYGRSLLISNYSAQTGTFIPLGSEDYGTTLAPYLMFFGQPWGGLLVPGINVNKGCFTGGLAYHILPLDKDAITVTFGVSKGKFKAGISHNIGNPVNPDRKSSIAGESEISLCYYFNKPDKTVAEGLSYYFRKMGF